MSRNVTLINSVQAAKILGVDRATLNRWAAEGRISAAGKGEGLTGARLFDRNEVQAAALARREELLRKAGAIG